MLILSLPFFESLLREKWFQQIAIWIDPTKSHDRSLCQSSLLLFCEALQITGFSFYFPATFMPSLCLKVNRCPPGFLYEKQFIFGNLCVYTVYRGLVASFISPCFTLLLSRLSPLTYIISLAIFTFWFNGYLYFSLPTLAMHMLTDSVLSRSTTLSHTSSKSNFIFSW